MAYPHPQQLGALPWGERVREKLTGNGVNGGGGTVTKSIPVAPAPVPTGAPPSANGFRRLGPETIITEYVGPGGLVPSPQATPRNQPLTPPPPGIPLPQPILLPVPDAPVTVTRGSDGTPIEVHERPTMDLGKLLPIGLALLTLFGGRDS